MEDFQHQPDHNSETATSTSRRRTISEGIADFTQNVKDKKKVLY